MDLINRHFPNRKQTRPPNRRNISIESTFNPFIIQWQFGKSLLFEFLEKPNPSRILPFHLWWLLFFISVRLQFIGCSGSDWKQCTKYNSSNVGITINGSSDVNHIRRNRFRSWTCGKKQTTLFTIQILWFMKICAILCQKFKCKINEMSKTFVYILIWFTKFRHLN